MNFQHQHHQFQQPPAFQNQQQWYFQQMMSQEKHFQELQLKKQQEMYEQQMQRMQHSNDQRFERMEKVFDLMTNKLKSIGDKSNDAESAERTPELHPKKINCPKWPINEPFKNFKANLLIWDKCHKSKGKYLELLESLQETKRTMEKQKLELKVQNGKIDPCDERLIEKVTEKFQEWFGKAPLDSTFEHWEIFIKLLRGKSEDVDKYVVK